MIAKKNAFDFNRLAHNEKIDIFISKFGKRIALEKETEKIYIYENNVWSVIDHYELPSLFIKFLESYQSTYSANKIRTLIETLKIKLPIMGKQSDEYIAFNNGLISRFSGELIPHKPTYWIRQINPHNYSFESKITPNFDKWLHSVSDNKLEKRKCILSALYMILTNRYNWQLFIEITGKGGSGKSIFTHIARLLAGTDNCANITLNSLENENARDSLINKTLIIANDQNKFTGDGSTLRAITGGDPIFINPKYKQTFHATIQACFVMTNNSPTCFTENNGGIARRRVLFRFDNVIPFNERDENLSKKLANEIAGIIAKIINTFSSPLEAKTFLEVQRESEEAQSIKSEIEPLFLFAKNLQTSKIIDGLYIGSKKTVPSLIAQSIYPLYIKYCEINNIDTNISSNQFRARLSTIMAEQGNKYPLIAKLKNNKTITNIHFKDNNFLNRLLSDEC